MPWISAQHYYKRVLTFLRLAGAAALESLSLGMLIIMVAITTTVFRLDWRLIDLLARGALIVADEGILVLLEVCGEPGLPESGSIFFSSSI